MPIFRDSKFTKATVWVYKKNKNENPISTPFLNMKSIPFILNVSYS